MQQMPKFVSMTMPTNSLFLFLIATICLLMAGEHGQPKAAHTLQLPQVGTLELQAPDPVCLA